MLRAQQLVQKQIYVNGAQPQRITTGPYSVIKQSKNNYDKTLEKSVSRLITFRAQ